jgi:hypothetical protein
LDLLLVGLVLMNGVLVDQALLKVEPKKQDLMNLSQMELDLM